MKIYRFSKIIDLPDGVKLPIGDAVILDNEDAEDPVAQAVKQAASEGHEMSEDQFFEFVNFNKLSKKKKDT